MEQPIFDPLLTACRFCMRSAPDTPTNSVDDSTAITFLALPDAGEPLLHSECARLYAEATGRRLDTTPDGGYPPWQCTDCERRIREAAATRTDLLRCAARWQELRRRGRRLTMGWRTSMDDDVAIGRETTATTAEDFGDKVKEVEPNNNNVESSRQQTTEQNTNFATIQLTQRIIGECLPEEDRDINANVNDSPSPPLRRSSRRQAAVHQRRQQALDENPTAAAVATKPIVRQHHHQSPPPPPSRQPCPICGRLVRDHRAHQRVHQHPERHRCAHCSRSFATALLQRQHERQHTGERPFVCDRCAFTFTSAGHLRRHMADRHGSSAAPAAAVRKNVGSVQQRIRRTIVVPSSISTASAAADDDAADDAILPPSQSSSRRSAITCPLCPLAYSTRNALSAHMKRSHGSAGAAAWLRLRTTVCECCGARCADAAALRAHRRQQHRPFECPVCRRGYATRAALELHRPRHGSRERPFVCPDCGARLPSVYALRRHRHRAHSTLRPFVCAVCGAAHAENADLNKHLLQRHPFEGGGATTAGAVRVRRTYECDLCDPVSGDGVRWPPAGRFLSARALRVHREKHTGEFRHRCAVCGRQQADEPALLVHLAQAHPAEARGLEVRRRGEARDVARAAARAEEVEMRGGASTEVFL